LTEREDRLLGKRRLCGSPCDRAYSEKEERLINEKVKEHRSSRLFITRE
jgi:hypothetical protein